MKPRSHMSANSFKKSGCGLFPGMRQSSTELCDVAGGIVHRGNVVGPFGVIPLGTSMAENSVETGSVSTSLVGMPQGISMPNVEQWVQDQNALHHLQQQAIDGSHASCYPMRCSSIGPNPVSPTSMCSGVGVMGVPHNIIGDPGFPIMDPSYEFNPDAVGPGGSISMPLMNLSHNKVPNESLMPEQLKNRSEKLTVLSKLKGSLEMHGLLDSENPGSMYGMSSQQHTLMAHQQQQRMMSQHPGMMFSGLPHPGMMSPQHQQYLMQQQAVHMEGSYPPGHQANFCGAHGVSPGISSDMTQMQARQAWMRMQQDYYESRVQQRSHQHQMMLMGGGISGPPPPYYSEIGNKPGQHVRPGPIGIPESPTSPGMLGNDPIALFSATSLSRTGMTIDPRGMDVIGPPGFDPSSPGQPPHSMAEQMMLEMATQGHMLSGAAAASGLPVAQAGQIGQGHTFGSGCIIDGPAQSGRKSVSGTQVTLHRAGNPEQFTPDPLVSCISGNCQQPPPYAQAHKRKRDDSDDLFKNLQPTPSPTQLSYLNQFEGQELTITKQLNTAYRESASLGASCAGGLPMVPHDPNSVPPSTLSLGSQYSSPSNNNPAVQSPMPQCTSGGAAPVPPCMRNPMSNSSQTSSTGHLGSPASIQHPPGPSPLQGAGMRLSHFDSASSGISCASSVTGFRAAISSSPSILVAVGAKPHPHSQHSQPLAPIPFQHQMQHMSHQHPHMAMAVIGETPGPSPLSNITSASLAHLAKDVDNLTSEMTLNMLQGGPFHSVQVQGQLGNGSNTSTFNK